MLDSIDALLTANEAIAGIAGYESDVDVLRATTTAVRYFALQTFVFVVWLQIDKREYHHYFIGCDPKLYYRYMQNKWYAIDPYLRYARNSTSPFLADEVSSNGEDEEQMRIAARENGFRGGVAIPAHSSSSSLTGVLFLGTERGPRQARESLRLHRNLMRALAMELLEWWHARQFQTGVADLALDTLDIELLNHIRDRATTVEAAANLRITVSCAKKRYERLLKKLNTCSKRNALEKAIAMGVIKPAR